jgi:hypothetical protein
VGALVVGVVVGDAVGEAVATDELSVGALVAAVGAPVLMVGEGVSASSTVLEVGEADGSMLVETVGLAVAPGCVTVVGDEVICCEALGEADGSMLVETVGLLDRKGGRKRASFSAVPLHMPGTGVSQHVSACPPPPQRHRDEKVANRELRLGFGTS